MTHDNDDLRALDIEIAKALGYSVEQRTVHVDETLWDDEGFVIITDGYHPTWVLMQADGTPENPQWRDWAFINDDEAEAWGDAPRYSTDANAASKLIEGDEDVTFEPPNRYNDNQWYARWHEYGDGHNVDTGESGDTFAECVARYWLRRQRSQPDDGG